MTGITAETFAGGYAGDPATATRRGRVAAALDDVRKKLTSSASSKCGLDGELLRLFAKGRRIGPRLGRTRRSGCRGCRQWVAINTVLIWLALDFSALGVAYRIAGKLLGCWRNHSRRQPLASQICRRRNAPGNCRARQSFGSSANPATPSSSSFAFHPIFARCRNERGDLRLRFHPRWLAP